MCRTLWFLITSLLGYVESSYIGRVDITHKISIVDLRTWQFKECNVSWRDNDLEHYRYQYYLKISYNMKKKPEMADLIWYNNIIFFKSVEWDIKLQIKPSNKAVLNAFNNKRYSSWKMHIHLLWPWSTDSCLFVEMLYVGDYAYFKLSARMLKKH